MFAFKKFPATIEQSPPGDDTPTYQVEVFGYLNLDGQLESHRAVTMVCFRQSMFWIAGHDDIGEIKFLPILEFEKKFKKFKLKEE